MPVLRLSRKLGMGFSRFHLSSLLHRLERWNRENPIPSFRLSLSTGMATYSRGANVMDVLAAADQRMYLHKGSDAGAHKNPPAAPLHDSPRNWRVKGVLPKPCCCPSNPGKGKRPRR